MFGKIAMLIAMIVVLIMMYFLERDGMDGGGRWT